MTCRISEETLHEYLDGELEELNVLVLEEHLRTSEDCRKKLEQIKALSVALESWAEAEIEMPNELDLIGRRVYVESTGKGFTAGDFLKMQAVALNGPLIFLDHMPGRRVVAKTMKVLSRSIAKTSGSLIKRSYKLVVSRR